MNRVEVSAEAADASAGACGRAMGAKGSAPEPMARATDDVLLFRGKFLNRDVAALMLEDIFYSIAGIVGRDGSSSRVMSSSMRKMIDVRCEM